jgi:hypothetical protein
LDTDRKPNENFSIEMGRRHCDMSINVRYQTLTLPILSEASSVALHLSNEPFGFRANLP